MSDDLKDQAAENIIRNHVLFSLGAAFVPIPLLDLVAVTAVQVDMLRQLSNNYGVEFKEELGKSMISSIASTALARYGASFVKAIPGIGTILGGISMSILSGASTYAMGQVFKRHFGGGGDLFNVDIEKAKKVFEDNFEKGKKVAKEMERKQEEEGSPADEKPAEKKSSKGKEIFDKLEKLSELKDKGVITEEDFNEQKDRLLSLL